MPSLKTKYFGTITSTSGAVMEFPLGLPGFDQRREFVAIHKPDTAPLVFLQSLDDPDLCFVTLPVLTVDAQYRLRMCADDLRLLGFPAEHQPRIGGDVLCLTVVSVQEHGPTANLLAPIVVNLSNLRGVQALAAEPGYSHQHALLSEEVPACS